MLKFNLTRKTSIRVPESRNEVYCFRLNFNTSELVYFVSEFSTVQTLTNEITPVSEEEAEFFFISGLEDHGEVLVVLWTRKGKSFKIEQGMPHYNFGEIGAYSFRLPVKFYNIGSKNQ